MEPLLKDEMAEDYLWEVLNPILVEALSMVKMRNDEILTLSLFLREERCFFIIRTRSSNERVNN